MPKKTRSNFIPIYFYSLFLFRCYLLVAALFHLQLHLKSNRNCMNTFDHFCWLDFTNAWQCVQKRAIDATHSTHTHTCWIVNLCFDVVVVVFIRWNETSQHEERVHYYSNDMNNNQLKNTCIHKVHVTVDRVYTVQ